MLEVSQGEASGAGDDEVEDRPAKTEAADLAGEPVGFNKSVELFEGA
jgi:hypothetical protein